MRRVQSVFGRPSRARTPDAHSVGRPSPHGTPLGAIFATNITPDIETGIGTYTVEDFDIESAPLYDDTAAKALLAGTTATPGAGVYASQCLPCHRETGAAAPPFLPALAGNPTVLDTDAASLINIVLNGSAPQVVKGAPAP